MTVLLFHCMWHLILKEAHPEISFDISIDLLYGGLDDRNATYIYDTSTILFAFRLDIDICNDMYRK